MEDADIRGKLLEHFYGLRHNNEGWIPVSEIILAPETVGLPVVFGVCQQLADVGLIQWKPLRSMEGVVAGLAHITGRGVAVSEASDCSEIAIRFSSKNKTSPTPPSEINNSPGLAAKRPELFSLKLAYMGIGVDLKELYRRIVAWPEHKK